MCLPHAKKVVCEKRNALINLVISSCKHISKIYAARIYIFYQLKQKEIYSIGKKIIQFGKNATNITRVKSDWMDSEMYHWLKDFKTKSPL